MQNIGSAIAGNLQTLYGPLMDTEKVCELQDVLKLCSNWKINV